MSIDPLKNNVLVQQAARTASKPTADGHYRSFERILQAANQNTGQPTVTDQADSVLRLAQLKLLQGLFVSDDEADQQADMFASLRLNTLVAPATGGNRQVDQLYRNMQPTLHTDKTVERSDIERMIDRVADHVSLAPDLIRSVVAAESDFQPQAVSHAGAQGLMQLMPATAKELGVQDSFDPQQNLLGGSRYLKQLLDKYDGDLDKALAAYNWGQGNVDRQGLEKMPQETRNYLAKVKGFIAAKG